MALADDDLRQDIDAMAVQSGGAGAGGGSGGGGGPAHVQAAARRLSTRWHGSAPPAKSASDGVNVQAARPRQRPRSTAAAPGASHVAFAAKELPPPGAHAPDGAP
jgi:hypothetical protein